MKPAAFCHRLIASTVLFAFVVTGTFDNLAGIDFKKAFAYSLPAGSSSIGGNLDSIKDVSSPVKSYQTDLFTGRAQASVPVFTPPGRRGLTPQVSLNYSSSGSNSWLGMGWNMDYGFIQRSTKKGVPIYNDSTDTFTFLIGSVNSDLHKISPTEYRAKDESGEFLKFTFSGNYWTVLDKSGTAYFFGQTSQAQISNQYGIFSWCLEKVKDVHGNTIRYTYVKDQGEIYIQRIDYNGNEAQSFSDTHSVHFTLENRPDVFFSYMTRSKVTTAKRLKEILVKVQGVLARKYILKYENSPNVVRSRLVSVQECGTDSLPGQDGTGTCLPAQTFTYQNQVNGFQSSVLWEQYDDTLNNIASGLDVETLATIDMDGDGLPDRVKKTSDTNWTLYRNTGTSHNVSGITWGPIQGSQDSSHSSLRGDSNGNGSYVNLLDLNGDGLMDRVVHGYSWNSGGTTGWAVQLNTGTGFANQAYYGSLAQNQYIRAGNWYHPDGFWPPDIHRVTWDMIDMNGDGYLDRVNTYTGTQWAIYFGNSSGLSSNIYQWGPIVYSGNPGDDIRNYDAQTQNFWTEMMDMNGDGLPDRVVVSYPPHVGYPNNFAVQFNNGFGFESEVVFGPILPGSGYIRQMAGNQTRWDMVDVNADGLPDRVHKVSNSNWNVYFNTGSSFLSSPVSWGPLEGLNDEDFAIRYDDGTNTKVDYNDINGDGFPDRIIYGHSGFTSNNRTWKVQLAYGTAPDLLKTINNGRGGITILEYKPSTQFDNRDETGIYRLPFPIQVVSKVIQQDGMGNSYETNYSYKGGKYDAATREFRGFREVTVTDARDTQTINTFYQDTHRRGRPLQTEVKDAQGNLFSKEVNDWGSCEDDAFPGVHFVKLRQTDQYLYDGDSSFKHTRKRFQYDASTGNLTTVFDDGDPETTIDDRKQVTTYTLNPSEYILNTVSKISAFNSDDQLINEKYFYYDNHTDISDAPEKGLLTKQEDFLSSQGALPAMRIAYDNFGNVQNVIDAMNRTTTNEFDPAFKLYLTKVTNVLGHVQEFAYDPLIAQITQTKDQNNQIARTVYDPLGRVIKVISPLDSENAPTKAVLYDDATIPNRVITHIKVDAAAPALVVNDQPNHPGYLTTYSFVDGLGRKIQERTPSEDSGLQIVSGFVRFDERGQISDQYVSYFADTRTTYASPPSSFPHAFFTYDAIGRRTRIDYPDGSSSSIEYDDYVKTIADPNGNEKRYTQDAFGNLLQVEEFNGAEIYTTQYQYDPLNRLIKTIDHLGNETQVAYDLLGRKTSMDDPNMGHWSYTYDLNNNLLTQTDAKNQTITFEYDELNRLKKKTYPDNTHIRYTYDNCTPEDCGGLPGTNYSIGKIVKTEDQSGIQVFRYDQLGRVIQDRKDLDNGESYTFTRVYDPQGRVTSLEYPDEDILNLTFNAMGEAETLTLIPLSSPPITIISNVNYNASGQITKIEYGNGVTSDYAFNSQNLRLEHLLTRNSSQSTLQDYTFQFDNAGNVLSITDAVNTNTQSFQYDDLDRLTQAQGSYGNKTYQYNAIGNMLEKDGSTLEYNDPLRPHAVTKVTNGLEITNYQYDANGNLIKRGNETLTYDYDNKLTSIVRDAYTETPQHTFQFNQGWNSFVLPFEPVNQATGDPISNIQDIFPTLEFGTDFDQISYWDVDTGEWKHSVGDSEFSDFTTLQTGVTYQIFSTAPAELEPTIHGALHTVEAATLGSYVYDASGQRVKRIIQNKTEYFLGKDYELNYTSCPTGMGSFSTKKAFFLGNSRIAEYEIMPQVEGAVGYIRFFHGDHLGSTNIITNEQGQQMLLMEYLPYGEVNRIEGNDQVQNTYTGQRSDSESNLLYYNARYYDPKIGRFITADSIVPDATDPQEFNRYSYVNNNPIRFTDPSGHAKWWKKIFKRLKPFARIIALAVQAIALYYTGNKDIGKASYAYTKTFISVAASDETTLFDAQIAASRDGAGQFKKSNDRVVQFLGIIVSSVLDNVDEWGRNQGLSGRVSNVSSQNEIGTTSNMLPHLRGIGAELPNRIVNGSFNVLYQFGQRNTQGQLVGAFKFIAPIQSTAQSLSLTTQLAQLIDPMAELYTGAVDVEKYKAFTVIKVGEIETMLVAGKIGSDIGTLLGALLGNGPGALIGRFAGGAIGGAISIYFARIGYQTQVTERARKFVESG